MIYKLTESQIRNLFENVSSNLIKAYHGSPYKFNSFDYKEEYSTQLGSDLGIFFTTEKKVAKQFADTYPFDMYQKIQELTRYYQEQSKQEKIKTLKNINFNEFINTLEKENYPSALIDNLNMYLRINNYEKVLDAIDAIRVHFTKENLSSEIYSYLKEYFNIHEKYSELIDRAEEEIIEKHKKQPGYLYTAKIDLGKTETLEGSNVGTGQGRYAILSSYSDDNYDTVYIKNADTGMGISDEVVVFDLDHIKIIDIEEV